MVIITVGPCVTTQRPTNGTRIDSFWQKILELRTVDGDVKYQVLGRLVRAALLLSHGSADVERGFSRSAQLMTSIQARTEERTLNAKAFVADALRSREQNRACADHKKLLCLARSARASYELYAIGPK